MNTEERINELERQLNELKASLKEGAKDNRPITERVKTFEDALGVLGEEHPLVQQWWDYTSTVDNADIPTKSNADLIAYYKLRIITAALNEGWEPEFTGNEWRYYPRFYLYTQEEWDKLSEEQKKGGVLLGGDAVYGATAGFAFAFSLSSSSVTDAYFGSRLCFKTDALVRYAGRQFAALYAEYLLAGK